ncbi:MAG: L-2-hydroxyglutarate oxidase [Bacteroidia bacterium]|nr:L-2-hydroxyglutarate oxidase [Bacteroidia bacterium]
MSTQAFDIIVVGGGIVGAASAYKLQLRYPDRSIALLEKEKGLADHQTGNNSGVIHSGIYYKPGSYKARNCVEGRRELVEFAKKYNIKHDVCGKLIVAVDQDEAGRLDGIYQRGLQNDIEDMRIVNADEMREIEPFVTGIKGIHVGCTGIIDFRGVTNTLGNLLEGLNSRSKVFRETEVTALEDDGDLKKIHTSKGLFTAKKVVFCGGLQSDRLAKMDGIRTTSKIVGFRGDYYDLTEKGHHKVKHLIYPVPNPAFPFLGVHFTRMTDGSIECGPNAVFTFKREGYGKTDFSLRDTVDALSFGGTWKLFFKHTKFGIDEYRRAFSKALFLRTLQRLVPSLEADDLKPGRAGVRAMALGPDGEIIDDFKIEYNKNSIHVLNAPSPAATACLAIGTEVTNMAEAWFGEF